ncbi:hypothetical protein [Devosia ginsengisoli]|uniref:hypothetical protein n=1 Tax=Devosia ginsengisoli TaxID=400770 RepID=UPI0026F15219|nr:hypothetical protein [Devosia ginsengisoli]MCR6669780.1 hypothetical protein [Devosia ginsengisoli]
MSSLDLQTLLRTFREVYPSVLIYAAVDYGDLVLIGSENPLDPTLENAHDLFGEPALAEELGAIRTRSGLDLLSLFLLDGRDILAMGDEIPVNTDDNMIIEYSAPKSLHAMTRAENFNLLLRHARLPHGFGSNGAGALGGTRPELLAAGRYGSRRGRHGLGTNICCASGIKTRSPFTTRSGSGRVAALVSTEPSRSKPVGQSRLPATKIGMTCEACAFESPVRRRNGAFPRTPTSARYRASGGHRRRSQ